MTRRKDELQTDTGNVVDLAQLPAFRSAVISSLGHFLNAQLEGGEPRSSLVHLPSVFTDETARASIAVLIGKPICEVTDELVQQYRGLIEAWAIKHAESLAQYLDILVSHLQGVGCELEGVASYLHLRRLTLGSLYHLVKEPHPSPSELKKLALRYALDARSPIEGVINRFTWARTEAAWIIGQYPSLAHRGMPSPLKSHHVMDPFAVRILDCALSDPPRIHELMQTIELILSGPPQPGDTLEAIGNEPFTYAIEPWDGKKRVRLWIDDREVRLPNWRDIHALLVQICSKPTVPLRGRAAQKKLGITNASQAVKTIRAALAEVLPIAANWLLSNPIRWAERHAPDFREPGRAADHSQE